MINVTKSALPSIEEYVGYLEGIWESGHLTNNGPRLRELEQALADQFGSKHVLLVSNATLALQLAIKALGLKGEVLTTPFSFVATASSVVWEGCDVSFADIDPETLCLSTEEVAKKMNSNISAILPTHVFGNPCDVEGIDEIAKEWNVPVLYDAAHTYGVQLNGESIMKYGDVAILSLHATKLFHTVEGGVIATDDDALAERLNYMRSFGFDGPEAFQGLGINAKMSEFHAVMGLCMLPKMLGIIAARQERVDRYDQHLSQVEGIKMPRWHDGASKNAAYYPVILASEDHVIRSLAALADKEVIARRYFYPSLTHLPYLRSDECPVAEDVSRRIICLPLYPDLCLKDVDDIANLLIDSLR